jgi:hypothetical protein
MRALGSTLDWHLRLAILGRPLRFAKPATLCYSCTMS